MRKIELSLSSDYVPEWTLADAIRELFQNALDQEAQEPTNTFSYDFHETTLRVCNKQSTLTTSTLLLGGTSKAEDSKTIGQFGEGYKIAALVLCRLGKKLTVYNYGQREVWRPRFVKSRRFNANILTFFIDKEYRWSKPPSDDLIFEVEGITAEEWLTDILPSNLHLQKSFSVKVSTEIGDVLDHERHSGMVFVNGLYVCKYDKYKYGYNFKPGELKLDRDRKLASDFDLKWLASRLWRSKPDYVAELVAEGIDDVAYVADMSSYSNDIDKIIANDALTKFRDVHGPRAVPVTYQSEADKVPSNYKAVIVSDTYSRLIKRADGYSDPEPDDDYEAPIDLLWGWYEDIEHMLTDAKKSDFLEIYEELKEVVK